MIKIGIFYATISKNTKRVAELIAATLNVSHNNIYNLMDIETVDVMLQYDLLILGSPTYGKGNWHYLWEEIFDEMKRLDFSHAHFSIFCLGDQIHHQKTFAGAMTKMYAALTEKKVSVIGAWSSQDYELTDSPMLIEYQTFPGLIIDEINQSNLTEARTISWCNQLISHLQS